MRPYDDEYWPFVEETKNYKEFTAIANFNLTNLAIGTIPGTQKFVRRLKCEQTVETKSAPTRSGSERNLGKNAKGRSR